jgi:AAHS family 4-hydroxybenzoate transporter-like MFS transporter
MHQDTRLDLTRLLDEGRWTAYQKWLVLLTAVTIIFDGIDNQILGIAVPTLMREWGVPRSAFALVTSLGYVGMMAGGALAGMVGDRIGRRTALLASMVLFGLMTLSIAWADGPGMLAMLRMLAGIGLGGAMPNAAALAAEYVPRSRRPLAVTLTIVCVPLGAMFAGLLGSHVLPIIGWRLLFIGGGIVPIIAALLLTRVLPESPRFLGRHPERWPELGRVLGRMGHRVPAGATFVDSSETHTARVSVGALFTPDMRRDTLALWTSFFSCLLSVYIGFAWLTALLASAGFSQATASSGITAFNLGGVAGALLGGIAIARIGSRASMLIMTAGAIAGAIVLSTMTISAAGSPVPLFVMLTLTGGLINAVQTTMYALAAHVYPSAVRATGVGSAVSFGRTGAILSGYVGTWAIDFGGSAAYFAVIAMAMTVCFLALAVVTRHVPPMRAVRA